MAIVLLGAGCARERVEGEIAGEPIAVASSWFTDEPEAFNGTDGRLRISLTSIRSACAAFAFWIGERDATADPEALAAAWQAAFPPEWWLLELDARTPDGVWPIEDRDWAGLAYDAPLAEPVRVKGRFYRFTAHPTADAFDPLAAADATHVDLYHSDLGVVQWSHSEPGVQIGGRFNTFAVDEEGRSAGRVGIRFAALPCPDAAGGL